MDNEGLGLMENYVSVLYVRPNICKLLRVSDCIIFLKRSTDNALLRYQFICHHLVQGVHKNGTLTMIPV